jgi:hypothetical protein
MAEDLMQTQTGGEGETVQLSPEVQQTPQQFDVNLPSAQQTPPSEPVQPVGPPMAEAPIVANQPVETEQVVQEVDSEQLEEEAGFMDWYSGDVTSAAEKILQDQTVEPRQDIQPTPIQEPVVADEQIKVRSINGIPIEDEVDEEIASAIPSSASDEAIESEPVKVLSINGIPTTPPKFEGVGTLPVMPLGVEADEFVELRNKYKDYNIETDIWGNVKATKKESGKPQGKKPTTTTTEKPKATVKEGQVLSYQYNEDFDYKIEGGFWRRKSKGSNNWQTLTNEGSIKALNNYFKTNVSNVKTYTGKPGYDYAIIDNQWNIRKKGDSSWMVMNNPDRVKALNKMHKKSVAVPSIQKEAITEGKGLTTSFQIMSQQNMVEGPTVSPVGKGNVFQQAPSRSVLFSDKPVGIYQSPASIQVAAQERNTETERQRKFQLERAKTDAERNKINQHFDKELARSREIEKTDIEVQKGVSKGLWQEIARPKPEGDKDVTIDISKELGINIAQDNIPILQKKLGPIDVSNEFVNDVYSQANSFINKDLDSWRNAAGLDLTESQLQEFKQQQKRMKMLLSGKENLSGLGALMLKDDIERINKQLEAVYKENNDTNTASSQGMSLAEFELEKKKESIKRDLASAEQLSGKSEFLGRTKNLFNSSLAIHDFVSDYLKSGDIIKDKSGKYITNPNIPQIKKDYIDNKLNQLNSVYLEEKRKEYNFFQEDIDKLRYEKGLLNTYINKNKNSLKGMRPGTEEYKRTTQKIKEATNKVYGINNKINDFRNDTRGLLSTEPEKVVASLSGVIGASDAKSIFSAIDKDLSPKVKFDRFYRRLAEENNKLAQQYGINTGRLDAVGARFRSMLDWKSVGINLTPQEKKWFANQRILNSLMPIYYNNETGITEESAGFLESFQNNLTSAFIGEDMAASQGDVNQTVILNDALNELKRLGFTEKDLQNPIDLKGLEKRKTVDWLSGEGVGEILAPTAAIIIQMVASRGVGANALKALKGVSNLVKVADKTGDLVGYGDKLQKVYDAYETSVKSSRLGRILWEAGEQGVTFELTGEVFGVSEEDMGAAQGFFGSLGGQAVGGLISKLPGSKFLPIVNKIFGDNTDKALKVMSRAGNVMQTATGETAEEFFEELTSIYQSTLDAKGFFAELDNRFGTFDKVMKFAVTSYALGVGMGVGMPNKNKVDELIENMPEADREKVNEALTAIREVNETATDEMDDAAKEAAKEIQIEQSIESKSGTEEQEKAEKEDAGIQFDVEGIIENDKEGEQVTEEVTESSFTQPIDLTDDKENKPGVSGEERKGEEPVKEQPVSETGKEEASPSGVVQKEQEVNLSDRSIDELEKRQFEIEESRKEEERKEFNQIDKELEKREWQSVLNAPLNEVNNIVDDLMIKDKEMPNGFGSYIDKSDARQTKQVAEKYSKEVSKEEAKKDFKDAFFGNPSSSYSDGLKLRESVRVYTEQGGSFKDLLGSVQKEFESDGFTEQDAANVINRKLQEIQNKGLSETAPKTETKKAEEEQKVTESEIEKIQEEIDSYDEEYNNLVDLVNKEERKLNAPKSENEIKLNQLQNKIQKLRDKRDGLKSEPLLSEEKPVSKSKRKRTAAKETGTKVVGEQVVEETKAEPAPKAEIGGIIRGYETISGENQAGDLRDKIPQDKNGGVGVIEGNDGNKYAVAFSRRGGDGETIFEQGASTPRPGFISASIKIEEGSTQDQINQAKKEALESLKSILPTVKGGKINKSSAQQALSKYQTKSEPTKTEAPVAEPSGKTGELTTTAETANQFKEASSISKMPMRSPKRKKAVADFDAKYGEGSYKRVSKIDANFGDIINKLENSNIVTKEC